MENNTHTTYATELLAFHIAMFATLVGMMGGCWKEGERVSKLTNQYIRDTQELSRDLLERAAP